jgi:hypothetical protein
VELAESARLRADVDFVWIGTKSLSVKFHGSPPSTFFLEVGQKPWTAWVSQAQQLCVFLA